MNGMEEYGLCFGAGQLCAQDLNARGLEMLILSGIAGASA